MTRNVSVLECRTNKTLVAAGSVVTQSVAQEGCLVAGVPAQVKKRYEI